MAYKLFTTHQFEKDLKRCKKRGLPMDKLKEVINELVTKGKNNTELTLLMMNTGTHADLFGKTKR